MTTKKSKETVSASFHFFTRKKSNSDKKEEVIPFTANEFKQLTSSIKNRPICDLNDKSVVDRLRFGNEVSLENMTQVNDRTVFGVFRAPYSGHAYDNSAKGKIPADSVSLRPFHYLLYFSPTGRIYLGSQYLGQFGAYIVLSRAIQNLMQDSDSVHSSTFRLDSSYYKDAQAKRVKVTFSRKPTLIASNSLFGRSSVIAIKKTSKDDGFETSVSEHLLKLLGQDKATIRKGIAKLVSENDLFAVSDEDIEDCTIVATVNGKRKTIYMLENGSFATKFPLNVPLNTDGHPEYEKTKKEMLELLKTEIIARN